MSKQAMPGPPQTFLKRDMRSELVYGQVHERGAMQDITASTRAGEFTISHRVVRPRTKHKLSSVSEPCVEQGIPTELKAPGTLLVEEPVLSNTDTGIVTHCNYQGMFLLGPRCLAI